MGMANQFLQQNLWPTITSRVRESRRNFIAVAYLGKGAKRLLSPHKNDVLVVDMSPAAVKSGQTNPSEIEKYLKKGVVVHSCPNLHAKVFVMDRTAIIGSGNASRRSKNTLLEAALLTTDGKSVNEARAFVQSCMGELITPAYVNECKRMYRPPRFGGTGAGRKTDHPRIWIQRLRPDREEDPNKYDTEKAGQKAARKQLQQKRKYFVEVVDFRAGYKIARFADLGDLIIQVWKEKEEEPLLVYPPSRVLHFRPYISKRGAKKILVFLESPKSPNCLDWRVFKQKIKGLGWSHIGKWVGREVVGMDMKRNVLGLWESWAKK
jgi:hypothetical protein